MALLAPVNVAVTRARLLGRAVAGLMDPILPPAVLATARSVLERDEREGVEFHALRSAVPGIDEP